MTADDAEDAGKQPASKRQRLKEKGKRTAKAAKKWITFIVALAVTAIGLLLLRDTLRPAPVAAAFTRVGGVADIGTSIDATRFWLNPPRRVVETRAHESQQKMWAAARCAMLHDAPLLFTSAHNKRKHPVTATVQAWRTELSKTQAAHFKVYRTWTAAGAADCRTDRHRADVRDLSTFSISDPLVRLPKHVSVARRSTLAPDVIFAAALTPGYAPDVALGLALGAHLAKQHHRISLVVVPRYLEADPKLITELENQHELVSGGIVLGQAVTVPESTRVLLRQLLTTVNQQNLLDQVKASLGSVGPLVAALLTLLGIGTAAKAGKNLRPQVVVLAGDQRSEGKPGMRWSRQGRQSATEPEWRTALGDTSGSVVTVWLRSGTRVTGKVKEWLPANASTTLVLENAQFPHEEHGAGLAIVSVEDIEVIADGQRAVSPMSG